jgi:glutamine cyclotransferase
MSSVISVPRQIRQAGKVHVRETRTKVMEIIAEHPHDMVTFTEEIQMIGGGLLTKPFTVKASLVHAVEEATA